MLVEFLGNIFICTIWFTPFTFIFFLLAAIKKIVNNKDYMIEGIISSVSLLFILIPMIAQF